MTLLGDLMKSPILAFTPPVPTDPVQAAVALVASAGPLPQSLGIPSAIFASCTAWTFQDDDAHEGCSLTACRDPLHPGPCKGWKHTLHAVAPGAYQRLEEERVRKANDRRLKRIADLKAQNKPIPRRLLEEIKPKPAPTGALTAQPLGKVGQKADLAGGQAHHAGQAVSNAAGVTVKTAPPLPLGPKAKKPTVAGRGPAFVITQPKVTDQYKLDKADKITAAEWAGLSDADKNAIRNELTAIKARGFGPQQTRADAILAKLPAPTARPTTPATPHAPAAPGKTTLGQAVKTVPAPSGTPSGGTRTPPSIALHRAWATHSSPHSSSMARVAGWEQVSRAEFDTLTPKQQQSVLGDLKDIKTHGALQDAARASDLLKKFATPGGKLAPGTDPVAKARSAAQATALAPGARMFVYGKLDKRQFDSLDDATKKQINADIDHQLQHGSPSQKQAAVLLRDRFNGPGVSVAPAKAAPAAPSAPHAPAAPSAPTPTAGLKPSAPLAPGTAGHVQHAHAVANRTAVKATLSKTHVDTYGKLTKAEFDALPPATQKTIRDDLANAKAKFLDPKKRQAAQDLLDRFGSRHPASVPATPGSAKGYSDPMNEAVKAARFESDRAVVLSRIGVLSHSSLKELTPEDRKTILNRLDATASSGILPQHVKDQAAAYQRIIEHGSPAQTSRKWDHEPSISELHLEEQKVSAAKHAASAAALATDALKAASDHSMPRADRVKALARMDKAQFDAMKPEDQRKVTDALQVLHADQQTPSGPRMTVLDPTVEKALTEYTGQHPAIHRLQQAEADFRAGKIDAEKVHSELVHARVQAPTKYGDPNSPGAKLEKEAQRVAEDNPTLPHWLRATMIDNPYGKPAYYSIAAAQNQYNFKAAPRLSANDISDIFRASTADLAQAHPVHAEAVQALREHLISTGLGPGSPWSDATKNHVVDNLLHISYSEPEVPRDRLDAFRSLPVGHQALVLKVMRDRLDAQTNDHAKTATFLVLRDLRGDAPLSTVQRDALKAAAEGSFPRSTALDAYRKLSPNEFNALPSYAQGAIVSHLHGLQQRIDGAGPTNPINVNDRFAQMPDALAAHLTGTRYTYTAPAAQWMADIANYGRGTIDPSHRVAAYSLADTKGFRELSAADHAAVSRDLDQLANSTSQPIGTRYAALFTKDFVATGGSPGHLNPNQMLAVESVNPNTPFNDAVVINHVGGLTKADYDALHPAYREAIDNRVSLLPGPQQQIIHAQLHPAAAPATPAGYVPTAPATVQPHVQAALDTIYGVHPKSHTMAHQLSTYGALRGHDFAALNAQEQSHLLGDLSFIATTAKGPSADKARKLIDRFTPAGTPHGQVPTPPVIPPANAVPGQVRYATPQTGTLHIAKDKGIPGDGWTTTPGGKRVWGKYGAAGLLLMHQDPVSGERRYLMVQRGPAISDPGKWQFPGGAIDSKETFHQGGAREVIEELGFKPDALSTAQVHGEHTNAIPGSSWKYVSVAAQVPTMLKPDLSTHHARAETSDAKWMTEAEIRKLDTDGKLLAPLAGGKLEQNVLSLFPQSLPNKLGTVARPGPVTKRQGRLNLPSGGRVPPTQFNAWPHPHKQSKGKDLIPDKAAHDALRQKIKQDRKLYDGKTADGRLAAIGAMQGFDDTPTVVDKKEMDRLLATGDYIEAWRGVTGAGGYSSRGRGGSGKTAAQINEEMRTGPAYYGKGIFGNGYYLATQRSVARQYADSSHGSVVRVLIPKTALTRKYDEVEKLAHGSSPQYSQAKGASHQAWSRETSTLWDPGRYAAAKGWDGIEIEPHHISPGGGARHVASPGRPAYNWLNRSVLIIQKEAG